MTRAFRTGGHDERLPAPARLLGWLPDGTPRHAPIGRLLFDGDRVCCHLCGLWFLSVASHLPVHGWTKADYVAAFGLERGNTLAGAATHKRRAAAFTARQVSELAIMRAQAAGRSRARDGRLTAAAAQANRGRAHPPERREKTLAALAAVQPRARAEGNARVARDRLEVVAASVATRFGFADFAGYARDRLGAGLSLAAMSRETGLHKDWMSRHLATIAPELSGVGVRADPRDLRWRPALGRLGLDDLAGYLRTRHVDQHRSVAAIALEAGVSRHSVEAALRRHGIERTPHAGKRQDAACRDQQVAERFGFDSVAAYAADRRAAGLTWTAMAAETGLAESTLLRRSRLR